jgi:hypothetical protein
MCVLFVNLYDFPIGAVPVDSVVFLFCFSLYIYMMSNVLLLVAIPGDPKAQQPTLAQGKSMALTSACFLYLVLGTGTSIKRWRDKTRSLCPNHPS